MIIYNSELYHYGMPRRSGRYKWGSGKDPYHHGADSAGRKAKADYKAAKKELSAARRKYGLASYKKAVHRHNMKASMNYPGVALSTIAKRSGHPGRDLKKTVDDRINNTYAGKKINKDYFNAKNNLNNKKEAVKTAKEAYKQTDQYKKDNRRKTWATIAAATTVTAAHAYLATHPEAMRRIKGILNKNKARAFTTEELRRMGIKTFKPDTFKVDRILVDRIRTK